MTIKYLDSKRIVATSDFIQGNSGGSGSVNSFYAGGGGGGSFSSGNNALSGGSGYGTGGIGGAGTPSSITGSVVIRAGGGGGGGHYAGAAGGSGGVERSCSNHWQAERSCEISEAYPVTVRPRVLAQARVPISHGETLSALRNLRATPRIRPSTPLGR